MRFAWSAILVGLVSTFVSSFALAENNSIVITGDAAKPLYSAIKDLSTTFNVGNYYNVENLVLKVQSPIERSLVESNGQVNSGKSAFVIASVLKSEGSDPEQSVFKIVRITCKYNPADYCVVITESDMD